MGSTRTGKAAPDRDVVGASPAVRRGERQRQRTREALIDAGHSLFAAQPLDSVSVDDIIGAAEVAKGSFYNHFEDKEEFAAEICRLAQEDVESAILAGNEKVDDPRERIARALCTVLAYAQRHPERLKALLSLSERRTAFDSPLNRGLNDDISEGLRRGHMQDVDVETGVLLVIGVIQILVRHVISGDSVAPPTALAISTGAALLRALGVDPGCAKEIVQRSSNELIGGPVTTGRGSAKARSQLLQ
jgi:AcrR family transcriptional regulator